MHCADVPAAAAALVVPCAGLGSLKDPLRMKKSMCVGGLVHVEVHTVVRACCVSEALVGSFQTMANWCWL